MTRGWRQQTERGSPWALRLILWIALKLGRAPARLLLYPITLYFFLFAPSARRGSADYLRRVYGRSPTLFERLRHLHCFAATILDRVFFLAGRFDLFDVRLHGEETLKAIIEQRQGCIFLSAHVGSFDALRALGEAYVDLPIHILMELDHNAFITQLLHTINPKLLERVIQAGDINALLRVQETLQDGEMIGVLADRMRPQDRAVSCMFLGHAAPFPLGMAQMAMVLQVPVVLCFALYRGGNRYDVYLEPFSAPPRVKRAERDDVLGAWVRGYVSRLESYVRKAPENWFNFYDFWDA